MMTKEESKDRVKQNLVLIQEKINAALNGKDLDEIIDIMKRLDRNKKVPKWFELLQTENRLPNLDGKTVGSVIEKLLVCIIEKYVLNSESQLSINPARGVDIPELELGVKSPSTNYDTSEPYFSAYERLLGNEYDAIILLTNYQEAKKVSPFMLQIMDVKYLTGSEIADVNLCALAKSLREKYGDTKDLQRAIRFLAYVNHSDWEANWILKLMREVIIGKKKLSVVIPKIKEDFKTKNEKKLKENKELISEASLDRLSNLTRVTPEDHSIINAADDWVISTQKDNGRYPNDNEWGRFLQSPLNGKIGMSFALQWRYNFRCLFLSTTLKMKKNN